MNTPEHLHTNLFLSSNLNTGSQYLCMSIQDQPRHSTQDIPLIRQTNKDTHLHPIHKLCRLSIPRFLHHNMILRCKNGRELLISHSNLCIAGHHKVLHIIPKNHLRGDPLTIPNRCNSKYSNDLSLACRR